MKSMVLSRKMKYDRIFFFVILMFISVVSLLFFAFYAGPFTENLVGYDAAFFRMVGQGMTKGMVPYVDFYDMKGPYLFFIEYMAQLICYGRVGIFIVECVNLFLVLLCTAKIFELHKVNSTYIQKLFYLLPVLCVYLVTLQGGNTNEEFSLLPLMIALYLCLKYINNCNSGKTKRNSPLSALIYGFLFGFLFFLRVNNSAFLLVSAFVIVVCLITYKEYKNLLWNSLAFVIGLVLVSVPVLIYYGVHNAVDVMFDSMFTLGFRYSGGLSVQDHLRFYVLAIPKFLLAFFPCFILVLFRKKRFGKKLVLYAVLGCVVTNIALAVGRLYFHYFLLLIPLLVLGEYLLLYATDDKEPACRRRRVTSGAVLFVMVGILVGYFCKFTYFDSLHPSPGEVVISYTQAADDYIANSKELCSCINPDEKDSVYTYGLSSMFYVYNDLFPCNRYCDWQKDYIRLIPSIRDELMDMLETDPPKWIILDVRRKESDAFEKKVMTTYKLYKENEMFALFEAKP